MGACEFILMLKKGKSRTINNPSCSNILRVKNKIGKKYHPTEKPVELMQILVENSSRQGDVILDPFMGSGSTGVACINTDRNFIGIELDEQYFEIARDRMGENL
jgi:site-specific DNA-methyltransferase (adenine-specific)